MQQRSQRYVRRQRGWIEQASAGEEQVRAAETDGKAALRGRRRRSHFDERLDATSAIVGLTQEDGAWIARSQAYIAPHIPQVAEDVYRALLSRPETAVHFANVQGAIDPAHVAMRREAFEDWLHAVVEDPLDTA